MALSLTVRIAINLLCCMTKVAELVGHQITTMSLKSNKKLQIKAFHFPRSNQKSRLSLRQTNRQSKHPKNMFRLLNFRARKTLRSLKR